MFLDIPPPPKKKKSTEWLINLCICVYARERPEREREITTDGSHSSIIYFSSLFRWRLCKITCIWNSNWFIFHLFTSACPLQTRHFEQTPVVGVGVGGWVASPLLSICLLLPICLVRSSISEWELASYDCAFCNFTCRQMLENFFREFRLGQMHSTWWRTRPPHHMMFPIVFFKLIVSRMQWIPLLPLVPHVLLGNCCHMQFLKYDSATKCTESPLHPYICRALSQTYVTSHAEWWRNKKLE